MVAMNFIYCKQAHKRRYDSQIACLYDNAGAHPNSYQCDKCGGWHLTRKTNKRVSRFKGGRVLHDGLATKQMLA